MGISITEKNIATQYTISVDEGGLTAVFKRDGYPDFPMTQRGLRSFITRVDPYISLPQSLRLRDTLRALSQPNDQTPSTPRMVLVETGSRELRLQHNQV